MGFFEDLCIIPATVNLIAVCKTFIANEERETRILIAQVTFGKAAAGKIIILFVNWANFLNTLKDISPAWYMNHAAIT